MTTYYVIDTRCNEIVNAITTLGVPSLDGWPNAEHLRLDANPPERMLSAYRFWNERP